MNKLIKIIKNENTAQKSNIVVGFVCQRDKVIERERHRLKKVRRHGKRKKDKARKKHMARDMGKPSKRRERE